jgi:hypothetical protein
MARCRRPGSPHSPARPQSCGAAGAAGSRIRLGLMFNAPGRSIARGVQKCWGRAQARAAIRRDRPRGRPLGGAGGRARHGLRRHLAPRQARDRNKTVPSLGHGSGARCARVAGFARADPERNGARRAVVAAAEDEEPVGRGTPEDRDIRFDMDHSFIWRTSGLPASVMWHGFAVFVDVDEDNEMG